MGSDANRGHGGSRALPLPLVLRPTGPGRGALEAAIGRHRNDPDGAAAAAPPLRLANAAVVTADWPHPPAEPGAVAARCEHRRSRRPCHPRAISSGHERYPAVTHGHPERVAEQAAGA
jgi:hypothetical protein